MKINSWWRLPFSNARSASITHHLRTSNQRVVAFHNCLATTVLLTLLASIALSQAPDVENYLGKNVGEVRILVAGAAAPPTVTDEYRTQIVVREGTPLTSVQIHDSLIALYNSARASNAKVEVQPGAGGSVSVIFTVTPQARVGEVQFAGAGDINIEDLRARLADLDRGARYSESAIRRAAEQVFEVYRDRGFYKVVVEPKVSLDPSGTIASITFDITQGEQALISSFAFEGDSKIPVEKLREGLQSDTGAVFSRAKLAEDIRRVRDLHLDSGHLDARIGPPDVIYDAEKNSVAIRVPITSGPVLTVHVEGYEIKDKKLKELLPILREGGLEPTTLEESARRLRSYLQEEGYFFAEVSVPPYPDISSGRADIVFIADPKQRYRITDIKIEGTKAIKFLDVESDLRSKTETFLPVPILSKYTRGITSEQALRRDGDLLVARLRDLGYRKARLLSVNRAVNQDNDRLVIVFNLEEGPRSYVAEVSFTGNTLNTVDELRSLVHVVPGDPASVAEIKIEGGKLLDHYFDRGYALATVSTRLTDQPGNKVRVNYEIREGPLVFINWVRVSETGSRQRTHAGRVDTFLRFKVGELLKTDELIRTEQELNSLGAFRRVQVRSEPIGPEGETGSVQRDVYVTLDEGKSRNLIYGGGYQSDEGFRGILEVSDPNTFGRLTTASLRLRVSQRNSLGQISYTDPRPFGLKTPVLASMYLQNERRPAFDSRRATALIQLERRITDRSLLLFRYSYEDVRVTNPEEVTDPRDGPIRLGRVSSSYALDARDNPFDATKGHYHSVDVSVALRGLGGTEQFARFFTENQYYRDLSGTGKTVLAGNLRLGAARNFPRASDITNPNDIENELLPITERFFSGGSTTLRGYDFEEAGPRDENNKPRGGNALVIFNAELRRSVYRQFALVGFYDGGNVFPTASRINFANLTHTVGLGVRIKTPLGPLRVDFAYLVSDPLTGAALPPSSLANVRLPRTQVHFSFGQAF
jgi:outer membrane protein insertion porin family